MFTRGVMLTVPTGTLTATQLERVGATMFALNEDGILTSYNPATPDGGVGSSSLAATLLAAATAYVLDTDTIVEIAGANDSILLTEDILKVRYASGVMLTCTFYRGKVNISRKTNVARITKHNDYIFENNFYRSGAGSAPLAPLLSDGTNEDIVSVFEGFNKDTVVCLGDIGTEMPVGAVGEYTVTKLDGALTLHLNGSSISIDDFGTLSIANNACFEIAGHFLEDTYDFSKFPASHAEYCRNHGYTFQSNWSGIGEVGHVLDWDFYNCRVPEGVPLTARLENISYVIVGGVLKQLVEGALVPINITTESGVSLIEYLYTHDLGDVVALNSANEKEFTPFNLRGIFFSYATNRHTVVDLANLPEIS